MSYGVRIRNGNRAVILGGDTMPFVVHSRKNVTAYVGLGSMAGFREFSVAIPSPRSLVFVPWNNNIQGGSTAMILEGTDGQDRAHIYAKTSNANMDVIIAVPANESPYFDNMSNYGMRIRDSQGRVSYDSRKPLIQIRGWSFLDVATMGASVPLDNGDANFVCQADCDLGISGDEYFTGALSRVDANTALMEPHFREPTSEWGTIPPYAGPSSHTAIFARINAGYIPL